MNVEAGLIVVIVVYGIAIILMWKDIIMLKEKEVKQNEAKG